MRKYSKLIGLSVGLLALIVVITLVMVFDVDLFLFKNLSISGIQNKKLGVEELMAKQTIEEIKNESAKETLQTSKNSFDVAKETYENIDDSTIAIVQEATKEEKYFIEYLWIVLGNYAKANNLAISIYTPGSTTASETQTNEEDTTGETQTQNQTPTDVMTALNSGVKIRVTGRYADVADFVFDVENDKSLKFKLDNIIMKYAEDNKIQATFDVLSLSVLN